MIIYGSMMYFKRNVVNSSSECEHCGQYRTMRSYQGRKFGHIYFIPLIPMGAHSQVLNECSGCKMGVHLPVAELEPRLEQLRGQFKSWIMAIQEGHREITLDGATEPVNVGLLLFGIIKDLYCLKEIESIDSICSILKSQNMDYEEHLVRAQWCEIKGDLRGAGAHYWEASKLNPDDTFPIFRMGKVEMLLGNSAKAVEKFEECLKLHPADLYSLIEIATIYEKKQDHPKIIETYDRLYDLNPELIPQSGMQKIYKKACKKTRTQGKYLDRF